MGWTGYTPTHFYNDKSVNRKAECDSYFLDGLNRGHYEIVKSSMRGSVYYGAVRTLRRPIRQADGSYMTNKNGSYVYEPIPNDEQETIGVVILTQTCDGYFYYKIISEDMGPNRYQCPKPVLDALTPTSNSYAIEWRKKCRDWLTKPHPSKLPIGTKIQFPAGSRIVTLEKRRPMYQFKTPWWYDADECAYYSKKRLPENFTIINT